MVFCFNCRYDNSYVLLLPNVNRTREQTAFVAKSSARQQNIMSNIYYYHLDEESKKKYTDKLEYNGVTLPDPLDTDERLNLFKSLNSKTSPNIMFGDIYMYLVEIEQTYSREEFKYYKILDCYTLVSNSKVRDVLAYKCENTNMCVLTCDIESAEATAKLFRAWAIASVEGTIQNGHCTCMKRLDKVCLHVAALLFSVENMNRIKFFNKDAPIPFFEEDISETLKNRPVPDYFENNKKKYVPLKASETTSVLYNYPGYKKQLKAIKKIVPNAPIFDILSNIDFTSSEDESADDDTVTIH